MLNYNEYEKAVYDWLMTKHQQDTSFTFSVRQKANKGAEKDYFIGTGNSKYFSTTFWYIPVAFPGSSADLINLIFKTTGKGYVYDIQFFQTRSPQNEQNRYALELIQSIKPELKAAFPYFIENGPTQKMEVMHLGNLQKEYKDIESLLADVDADITKLLTIVDNGIANYKKDHPEFEAYRFTAEDFSYMIDKMKARIDKYSNVVVEELDLEPDEADLSEPEPEPDVQQYPLNQILFGPPGTGKTYNTINKALEIINESEEQQLDWRDRRKVKALFDKRIDEGQIVFTTFHQSMSYEDFIEGIKPVAPEAEDAILSYEVEDGIFKKLCQKAQQKHSDNFEEAYLSLLEELYSLQEEELLSLQTETGSTFWINANSRRNLNLYTGTKKRKSGALTKAGLQRELSGERYYKWWKAYFAAVVKYMKEKHGYTNAVNNSSDKKYILIIDEINRGNVSQIFGELITLIEEDKRLGKDEALKVTLPYSKQEFGVPANLYIIGTMNTADRSVEALDAALRRRFSFEEMVPKPELIATAGQLKESQGMLDAIDLPLLLKTINRRIEKLLDRDHQIGHSYFLCVSNLEELKDAFQKKIIPLLQEYFFGDYGKIGMVLGKGFVSVIEKDTTNIFADFSHEEGDFAEKTIYAIEKPVEMEDGVFTEAIRLLLNSKVAQQ